MEGWSGGKEINLGVKAAAEFPESHAFLAGAPQTIRSAGTDEARIGKFYTRTGAVGVAPAEPRAGVRPWSLGGGGSQFYRPFLKFLQNRSG